MAQDDLHGLRPRTSGLENHIADSRDVVDTTPAECFFLHRRYAIIHGRDQIEVHSDLVTSSDLPSRIILHEYEVL